MCAWQDLRTRPHIVQLLPPVQKAIREEPLDSNMPRIEPYDPGGVKTLKPAPTFMYAMARFPSLLGLFPYEPLLELSPEPLLMPTAKDLEVERAKARLRSMDRRNKR